VVELTHWVELGWVMPDTEDTVLVFREIDVARVRLIHDLRHDMDIGEDAIPLVLSLLDQSTTEGADERSAHRRGHNSRQMSGRPCWKRSASADRQALLIGLGLPAGLSVQPQLVGRELESPPGACRRRRSCPGLPQAQIDLAGRQGDPIDVGREDRAMRITCLSRIASPCTTARNIAHQPRAHSSQAHA